MNFHIWLVKQLGSAHMYDLSCRFVSSPLACLVKTPAPPPAACWASEGPPQLTWMTRSCAANALWWRRPCPPTPDPQPTGTPTLPDEERETHTTTAKRTAPPCRHAHTSRLSWGLPKAAQLGTSSQLRTNRPTCRKLVPRHSSARRSARRWRSEVRHPSQRRLFTWFLQHPAQVSRKRQKRRQKVNAAWRQKQNEMRMGEEQRGIYELTI